MCQYKEKQKQNTTINVSSQKQEILRLSNLYLNSYDNKYANIPGGVPGSRDSKAIRSGLKSIKFEKADISNIDTSEIEESLDMELSNNIYGAREYSNEWEVIPSFADNSEVYNGSHRENLRLGRDLQLAEDLKNRLAPYVENLPVGHLICKIFQKLNETVLAGRDIVRLINPKTGLASDEKEAAFVRKSVFELKSELYELSQRYCDEDKYWLTRSGYIKKDVVQAINEWTGADRVVRWRSQLVVRKGEIASEELKSRYNKDAELIEKRYNSLPEDESIPVKTRMNLRKIDRWILNQTKLTEENEGFEQFQVTLMRLSDRERLYLYYLVENKRRKNPDEIDLAISQMTYVPDPEAFADIMVANRLKFWKGYSKMSRVYWSKLEDAYFQLKGVRSSGGFAKLEKKEKQEEEKEPVAIGREAQKQDIKENEPIPDVEEQVKGISLKEERRRKALDKTLRSLQNYYIKYRELDKLEKEGLSKTTTFKKQKKIVEVTFKSFSENWEELSKANKAMPGRDQVEKLLSYNEEGREDVQSAGKITSYIQYANHLSKANKATMVRDMVNWEWIDQLTPYLPMVMMGGSGLGALGGLVSGIMNAYTLAHDWNVSSGMENLLKASRLAYTATNVYACATTLRGVYDSFKNGVSLEKLTEGVATKLTIAGGVMTGLAVVGNIAEHVSTRNQKQGTQSAKESFRELREKRKHRLSNNPQGQNVTEAVHLEDTMQSLEEKIQNRKKRQANVNSVSAAVSVVSFIPGASVLAVGILATTITGIIRGYKDSRKNIKEIAKEYLKEAFAKEYKARYNSNYEPQNAQNKDEKKLLEKRERSVMNYICGQEGFGSIDSFVIDMITRMANHTYKKLFFKDEECQIRITKEDLENNDELIRELKPYFDTLSGLGLKPEYYSKDSTGTGRPSPREIFLALQP